jgi:diguanylate cyclase (GGDEF)-like protein
MNARIDETTFLTADTPVTLSNCDLEPIHTPSLIQPHGVLIVGRDEDKQVVYVSKNSLEMLGIDAAFVLRQTLPALLGEKAMASIEASLLEDQTFSTHKLTFSLPVANETLFDCIVHRANNLYYVELEPASDENPWTVISGRIQAMIGEFRTSATLKELCDTAAIKIRNTTGYDRVMIYRFDPDANGEVIAEDKADDLAPFLGLHFPATDIPVQARKLYLLQRQRLIVDVAYRPVPLLAHPSLLPHGPTVDPPLDMTYCALRGISPMHLEYLTNMGVQATLCVSLVHEDRLWGMIVCHHRTAKRPSSQTRALTALLGELMSVLITVMEQSELYSDRLAKQQLIDELSSVILRDSSVAISLTDFADQLLALMNASGACLCLGGQTRMIGEVPDNAELIMKAFRGRLVDGIAFSDQVGSIFPEFACSSSTASGALMVKFINRPDDGIIWFRKDIARTVLWGGNPDQAKLSPAGATNLSPRKSFAAWEQIQRGRSRPWTKAEVDATRDLQRIITASMLHRAEAELAKLSQYDPLTNLPNRRVLLDQLTQWHTSDTTKSASLLFLDLDNFKTVNDSLGHDVGDELLKLVAARLLSCAQGDYLVARLGGDEFVLFCPDTSSKDSAALAAAILDGFVEPFILEGKPYRTMASIGIAMLGESGQMHHADSLRAADSAMYLAKHNGGNQAAFYESPQHDKIVRQHFLEQALFQALARDEFEIVYQPQVSVSTGKPTGFEALVRWRHAEFGMVMPGEFIPIAEKLGLINAIGYWVLEHSLFKIRQWREQFKMRLSISVNISAQQVIKPDCCSVVDKLLQKTGVPPSALCLEVTETILMQDLAVDQINRLRALGVRVSIDDFGTGYSSLAYLLRIPVDEVKLDRSLMLGVGENHRKTALLGSIVRLAHTLDLNVVAEGVECSEQWNALSGTACECAQGYFLSHPITADGIEEWLKDEGKTEIPRIVSHPTPYQSGAQMGLN